MYLLFSAILAWVFLVRLILGQTLDPQRDASVKRDYCENPETESQRRLLDIAAQCTTSANDCASLSDCLSENLVKIANETVATCRNAPSAGEANSGGAFRPCSVAATVYVILEQVRRLLAEDTVYKGCNQVTGFFQKIIKQCGGEEAEKALENQSAGNGEPNMNDLIIQDVLAKYLVSVGKRMQMYDIVKEDIEEMQRSKHMKALGAMVISFALPGLLGLCEASHFRTGLFLQILALVVIGIYQFTRYGGYWALLGVGSCLLVMTIELALLVLIRRKFYGEESEEEKKTE